MRAAIAGIVLCALVATASADDQQNAINIWVYGNQIFKEAQDLEASQHFAEARRFYRAAAEQYVRAWTAHPAEDLQFNLAQAKRKAGLLYSSLVSYQVFIKLYPTSPRYELVMRRIDELRLLLTIHQEVPNGQRQ